VFTIGFLVAAYYHQPRTMIPILISMAILALEWCFRLLKMTIPLPQAATEIYPGDVVGITMPLPTNPLARLLWSQWRPGAHVRLTIPGIGILQPHPFTIASTPHEQCIRFYIRSRRGFTKKLYEKASDLGASGYTPNLTVHFEGIYGARYPDFGNFDVVLLVASGISVTFILPILKDLVLRTRTIQAQKRNTRCKRIGFVWIVKHRGTHSSPSKHAIVGGTSLIAAELSWFTNELSELMNKAYGLVAMRLYITQPSTPELPPEKLADTSHVIPENLVNFVRLSPPKVTDLVEQAVDEARVMGRLGVGCCGSSRLVGEVKNAAARNLEGGIQDIYCHAEEFGY